MESETKSLTEKQERFCQYYAQLTDTYNNGTWSYALGYGHELDKASKDDAVWDEIHEHIIKQSTYDRMYNTCSVEANRLLRNPKILKRIQEIKSSWVDDDKIIDSRMMDIIQSGKDTDALAAIKHRNELKNRVTKKIELTSPVDEILARYGLGDKDAGKAKKTES